MTVWDVLSLKMFDPPWRYLDKMDDGQISLHSKLTIAAFVLSTVSFVTQWRRPAPYGRFDTKDRNWGPRVNQRIGHVLNDGLWGVTLFIIMYFYFEGSNNFVNNIFVIAWLLHFIQRGFLHPVLMNYSSETVPLGIPVTGLTLAFFAYLHASFLTATHYDTLYILDFRFIIGGFLFIIGFIINRLSDMHLRSLRKTSNSKKYFIPSGILFKWISCSNYFGELVEWLGWAIAMWSPCGIAYFLFTASTFIPRARHIHDWYLLKFKTYPQNRKAIIPFLF